MHLISITLRNYRVHRELTVAFDRSRTLIGGSNEVGKSTLAEAMHRVLFMKAKGNTELHRLMKSTLFSGQPEVELQFEADGRTYRLRKRFGSSGEITLSPYGSKSLSGDDAEAELTRILRAETGLTGKASLGQWGHLWVLQGQSANDPTVHATDHRNALVTRLQNEGASAVLESDLDAKLAGQFSSKVAELFTKNNKPRAGSDLAIALSDAEEASETLKSAQRRVKELDGAAVDLETSNAEMLRVERALSTLREEQTKLDERTKELNSLKEEEYARRESAANASKQLNEMEEAEQKLVTTRSAVAVLEKQLKPQTEEVSNLDDALRSVKLQIADAEAEQRTASNASRDAGLRVELAAAQRQQLELKIRKKKLEKKAEQIRRLRATIADLNATRAEMPDVENDKLEALRTLESEFENANAALQAMATALEVIYAEQDVRVNGSILAYGQRLILADEADIHIGDTAKLRLSPGGGTNLTKAKQRMIDAENQLANRLTHLGVTTVQEAAGVCIRRSDLASKITELEAELHGIDPNATEAELISVETRLDELEPSIQRGMSQFAESKHPQDTESADAMLVDLRTQLSEAHSLETVSQNTLKHYKSECSRIERELEKAKLSTKKNRDALRDHQVRLRHLTESFDEDGDLDRRIETAHSFQQKTMKRLMETQRKISSLQPDDLESDRQRIVRSLELKQDQVSDLRSRIAVARSALRNDGHEDPRAAYASAKMAYQRVEEHSESVSRKANAFAMLDRLFQEEQRSLADRFTQRLAEKFSDYLRFVFGPEARANVRLEKNRFSDLQLSRQDDGTLDFGDLSGGTKEQLAAAVRLAMAEVLAGDHDGTLPVVFDDAFACSDPIRIQSLQRMLDLAATRGLQVIVLTCKPEDYASFGAKHVMLRKRASDLQIEQQPTCIPDHSKGNAMKDSVLESVTVEAN